MFYKLDEYVYLVKDKYTFKEVLILDNNRLVHCLVAVNGDTVHGLLQSFDNLSTDEEDKAISDYLRNRRRLINYDYANAKDLVKLTSYNGKKY